MRGLQWKVAPLLVALVASGCGGPAKRSLTSNEPALSAIPGDSGVAIVDRAKPVLAPETFVDRHPLFSKPRQYYENTGTNKVTKTAAAAVLGVPAGIYGELKQIVVGAPPTTPASY
ncbi:hypothetical protein P12x_000883 [Tundrisphaera lichenicola]|uniref:hypothetical protein n=1 Tax=Tundrisphaera lichenicola TaxID=2029860 RepID=UPI003EB84D16